MKHSLLNADWPSWAALLPLIAWGVHGDPRGILLAALLCVIQIAHVAVHVGATFTLPLQVRGTYLVMLLAGLWPPLSFLHWIQLIGTAARVLVGYCLLARLLSLLPLNRREPFTWALAARRLFAERSAAHSPCMQYACTHHSPTGAQS